MLQMACVTIHALDIASPHGAFEPAGAPQLAMHHVRKATAQAKGTDDCNGICAEVHEQAQATTRKRCRQPLLVSPNTQPNTPQ